MRLLRTLLPFVIEESPRGPLVRDLSDLGAGTGRLQKKVLLARGRLDSHLFRESGDCDFIAGREPGLRAQDRHTNPSLVLSFCLVTPSLEAVREASERPLGASQEAFSEASKRLSEASQKPLRSLWEASEKPLRSLSKTFEMPLRILSEASAKPLRSL